jgi:hypothetical protein
MSIIWEGIKYSYKQNTKEAVLVRANWFLRTCLPSNDKESAFKQSEQRPSEVTLDQNVLFALRTSVKHITLNGLQSFPIWILLRLRRKETFFRL